MSEISDRLRTARTGAGYKSASQAAEAMGVPVPTYIGHENGSRAFDAEACMKYADFFVNCPCWIMFGNRCADSGDKVDGLLADLDAAVEVAFVRGATEWVRLNYPENYHRLKLMFGTGPK